MIINFVQKLPFFVLPLLAIFGWCGGEETDIPKHLADLHRLEENTLPEDTTYHHGPIEVEWSENSGIEKYVCRTDCSGLLNALFAYSFGVTEQQFIDWLGVARPKAVHYAEAIKEEKKFERILSIQNVLPGDVFAMHYLPHPFNQGWDTGHVVIADSYPLKIEARPPHIPDTDQWAVNLIDCSNKGHDEGDSRLVDGSYRPGLGKGTFRVYTDKFGEIVGYTPSMSSTSIFYDADSRPIYAGRIMPTYFLCW